MFVKTIARKTLGLKNHKIDKVKETSEGTIEIHISLKKEGYYLVRIMTGNTR
jgi:hypothetical protein